MLFKRCLQRNRSFSIPGKNHAGLTLIESLVAIVVIAVSAVVIAPVLVLATATRVQTQRAEQAFQLAQAEIDRVKFIVADNDVYAIDAAVLPAAVQSVADFGAVAPPETIDDPDDAGDTAFSDTPDAARGIDVDRDGTFDFAAQVFRTVGITSTDGTNTPLAFDLGVRIYSADDVNNRTQEELSNEQGRLGLGFVTSNEDPGPDGLRPRPALSVLTTTIVKSDNVDSLCDYYEFIDDINGTTTTPPAQC